MASWTTPGSYSYTIDGSTDVVVIKAAGGEGDAGGGTIVARYSPSADDTFNIDVGSQRGGGNGGTGDYGDGGDGGASSDVRFGGDTLDDRILVGGAGGGDGGSNGRGGGGGLPEGEDGTAYIDGDEGGGGTQTAGGSGGAGGDSGSFGFGGDGASTGSNSGYGGGGGGNGYYGGGGGGAGDAFDDPEQEDGGGGGGSSFWDTSFFSQLDDDQTGANAGDGYVEINEYTRPDTPTNVSATVNTDNHIDVSWDESSGASEYEVYRGGSMIATTTDTSYTDSAVSEGTAYSYQVRAVNDPVESDLSSTASTTTNLPAPEINSVTETE